ncbi:7715_t:CDS:2, partial [Entrophospora sp. SA101]
KSKTVLEFKQLIGEKSEIPADRQRLIYSGKVSFECTLYILLDTPDLNHLEILDLLIIKL